MQRRGKKTPLRLRCKENKEADYWGKSEGESLLGQVFFLLLFILLLALWMGGAFLIHGGIFIERRGEVWLGWNIHWEEGRGVAWMEPSHLISWSSAPFSWSHCTCAASKSCFPSKSPLLVEPHTWKVIQGQQQPVPFYCSCSMVFMVRVSFLFLKKKYF